MKIKENFLDTNRKVSWGFVAIMLIAFILFVCARVRGQEGGRPDTTGRGRYTIVGDERLYSGAHVVNKLPAGAQCNPVGELIGSQVFNSTREGRANLVVLTDKAEIATTSDGRIFLCHCAQGFNELFLVESNKSDLKNLTLAQVQAPGAVNVNVYNDSSSTTSSNPAGGGGIPAPAVYEYVNGCAVASISMGIRVVLEVPICPQAMGSYYSGGYQEWVSRHSRGGGGGWHQPSRGRGYQPPTRPVQQPPRSGGGTLSPSNGGGTRSSGGTLSPSNGHSSGGRRR